MAYSKLERQTRNDEMFRSWRRTRRDLWLYLLCNPHMDNKGGRTGCYVLDPMYIVGDLTAPDWKPTITEIETELRALDAAGRIVWDPAVRLVLICNFFRHNQPENPNVATAAAKDVADLPLSETVLKGLLRAARELLPATFPKGGACGQALVEAVEARLRYIAQRKGLNSVETVTLTLPEQYAKPWPNPEPEPEPEPEQEPTSPSPSRAPDHAHEDGGGDVDHAAEGDVEPEKQTDVASDVPPPVEVDKDAIREQLQELVNEFLSRVDEGREKKALAATLRVIVSGSDITSWRNAATGGQVPWTDRRDVLDVAISKYEAGERDSFRGAMILAVQQQKDPLPVRTSNQPPPGSPAADANAKLRRDADGREIYEPDTTVPRSGDPYLEKDLAEQRERRRLDEWLATHAEEARAIAGDVEVEIAKNPFLQALPKNILDGHRERALRAKASERIRSEESAA